MTETDAASDFFAVGRSFIDSARGRLRVAANDGVTLTLLAHGGAEYRETLAHMRMRRKAGAVSEDEVGALRAKVPPELRFPEERSVVTVREIAQKWRVDDEQVRNVLRRDKLKVLNISAGLKDERVHNRLPVGDYYKETIARLDLIDEARRWTWFGQPSDF